MNPQIIPDIFEHLRISFERYSTQNKNLYTLVYWGVSHNVLDNSTLLTYLTAKH